MVVAVHDLSPAPQNVTLNVGGMDIKMGIRVIKWVHGQLYTAVDFPKPAVTFASFKLTLQTPSSRSQEIV
jgi:hypothetical protein